jgi:hypothetical protein
MLMSVDEGEGRVSELQSNEYEIASLVSVLNTIRNSAGILKMIYTKV